MISIRILKGLTDALTMFRSGKYYLSSAQALLQATLKIKNTGGTMEWIHPKYRWLDGLSELNVTKDGGDVYLLSEIIYLN